MTVMFPFRLGEYDRFFDLSPFYFRFVTKEVAKIPVVIPLAVDFGCMFRDQSPTGTVYIFGQ